MSIKYTLSPVRNYTGTLPTFEAGVVLTQAPEADQPAMIINASSSIAYSVDVFQAQAAINRVGSLTLNLNNPYGQFSAHSGYFANSDRDHRLVVSTAVGGVDRPIWWGYVKEIRQTGDEAQARVLFDHELNRLDDIAITGDEARPLMSFDDLLAEVNEKLPAHVQFETRGAIAPSMFHRPERNAPAREFMGAVMAAERLIGFHSNVVNKWVIASADALDESQNALHIRQSDLIALEIEDGKQKNFNVIQYRPYSADGNSAEVIYEGEDEIYKYPGNFIYATGRKPLNLNFAHLDPDIAEDKAEIWQSRVIKPRRRCTVEISIPAHSETIGISHLVYLEADHVNMSQLPYVGWFRVVGMALKPQTQSVKLNLVEIIDRTAAIEATLAALTLRNVA